MLENNSKHKKKQLTNEELEYRKQVKKKRKKEKKKARQEQEHIKRRVGRFSQNICVIAGMLVFGCVLLTLPLELMVFVLTGEELIRNTNVYNYAPGTVVTDYTFYILIDDQVEQVWRGGLLIIAITFSFIFSVITNTAGQFYKAIKKSQHKEVDIIKRVYIRFSPAFIAGFILLIFNDEIVSKLLGVV